MKPSFYLWAASDSDVFDVFQADGALAPARARAFGANDAQRLENRFYIMPVVFDDNERELRFAGLIRLFPEVVYLTAEPGQQAFLAARAAGASVSEALSQVLALGLPETHTGQVQQLIAIHQENEATAQSLASLFEDPAGILRQAGVGRATPMNINPAIAKRRNVFNLAPKPQPAVALNPQVFQALAPLLAQQQGLGPARAMSGTIMPANLPGGYIDVPKVGSIAVAPIVTTVVGTGVGALVASKHRVAGAAVGALSGLVLGLGGAILYGKFAGGSDAPPSGDQTA